MVRAEPFARSHGWKAVLPHLGRLLTLIGLMGAIGLAQELGEFRGEVWTLEDGRPGRPLAGVTLTLAFENGPGGRWTVTSGPDGAFRIGGLPLGIYRVTASRAQQPLGTLEGVLVTGRVRLGRLLIPLAGGPLRFEPFPTAAPKPPSKDSPVGAAPPPAPSIPPPTPSPAPEQPSTTGSPSGVAVVPVFYATDRAVVSMTPLAYGTQRTPTGALSMGRCDVSIPRDHAMGQVERPTIWTFWREDPQKHLVITSRRQFSYDHFYQDVRGVVQRSTRKEAFVFIHGFNVSFESAIFRTAQIAYDLGFDGAPILYSWPSAESLTPIGYATDAASADWTVSHLRYFLEDVANRSGAQRVHLIAHSMGNKALVNALDRLSPSTTLRFSQILLTAPDIDADTFVQLADAVRRSGQRATLYASANDKALLVSKKLQTYRRAGDTSGGVLVVPGIDTIDVSDVDTDLVGHFYYGANTSVISDMFLILSQGAAPSERPRLRRQGTPPKQFWKFMR